MRFNFVILFGSALVCPEKARDIDVAFGGNVSEADAILIAQEWARKNDLEDLPIDAHRFYAAYNGKIELPVPHGMGLKYQILVGEVTVRESYSEHLPAIIRLGEKEPERAERIIKRELLSNFSFGSHANVIGISEINSFSTYAGEGPVALANALCHVNEDFLRSRLGEFGKLLAKIKDCGSKWSKLIRPEAEKKSRENCPGNFGRYYFYLRKGRLKAYLPYKKNGLTLDEFWKEVVG
jgi:hypothetical protein